MRISSKLSQYLFWQFFKGMAVALFGIAVLVLLFDTVELMRRAAGKDFIPFSTILGMGLLKLPQMLERVMPFIALFGSMFVFWRLSKSQELVVLRGGGISVWQFLKPALALAFVFGIVQTALINPFSASLYNKFEQLEARHFEKGARHTLVTGDGIWLREFDTDRSLILNANIIEPDLTLRDISIFVFDGDYKFQRRIDAAMAKLMPGHWSISNAYATLPDGRRENLGAIELPSRLTLEKIQDGFASPETLSVWQLPGFISTLEKAGFSALRHKAYWHGLLTKPFLFAAMIIIAACFSISPARNRNALWLVAGGLFAGFAYYVFTDITQALGQSGRIPVTLAMWAPFFVATFLSAATLLHLEDG